ncbi:MAG: ribose-phosphate pyrophosphokinase [Armatimonadetes bacterium]|nr:ribose-phosphate diphosphokinase [Armatimonadota bacterium]MBS1702628.1 ribose-phosphate pyrophosphokinase [Armatimonadota bacterium]MBS1726058.1 ribose-phosphate pyrophosphokinase [Armatimonadota bacterium]
MTTSSETFTNGLKLFAGNANPTLAARVAAELGVELGNLRASKFADGEIRIEIQESARGADVFILQPTCAPTNDNLMELFILLDAFRRASAKRITVVMPYYGYARQDKKIKPREPITARLVADMVEMCGANRVVTLDLHADQIQGFFNIPVDHLYGGPILGEYFIQNGLKGRPDVCVVAPDVGGVGRAKKLADMLECPFIVIAKRRPAPNTVEVVEIVGDFTGKRCVMIDDMIDTGGSIASGAQALLDRGAKEIIACCTHAILSDPACERLQNSCISEVVVLDTVYLPKDKEFPKLTVLSAAPLIASAIKRIHNDESVSELFGPWG